MGHQLWRRLLPDRSQLWILAAVLVVIFAGVSFYNVASAKSAALSRQRAVQAQLAQLEEQNRLLQEARAARGKDVELLARRYYGYSLPGETRIIGRAEAAAAAGAEAAAPVVGAVPAPGERVWQGWLRQLTSILTTVKKWVQ